MAVETAIGEVKALLPVAVEVAAAVAAAWAAWVSKLAHFSHQTIEKPCSNAGLFLV